eukprot:TRINITY_DN8824_c0_g1_i1.p1 TRINITY_DN8824_c0_g1~~TRINITY_DN8824_c0_g1_i1.p1  ORF type:complete len:830 (+),score=314.57 TRINITY_DN8824_c0_g1_i1:84-2573(+)
MAALLSPPVRPLAAVAAAVAASSSDGAETAAKLSSPGVPTAAELAARGDVFSLAEPGHPVRRQRVREFGAVVAAAVTRGVQDARASRRVYGSPRRNVKLADRAAAARAPSVSSLTLDLPAAPEPAARPPDGTGDSPPGVPLDMAKCDGSRFEDLRRWVAAKGAKAAERAEAERSRRGAEDGHPHEQQHSGLKAADATIFDASQAQRGKGRQSRWQKERVAARDKRVERVTAEWEARRALEPQHPPSFAARLRGVWETCDGGSASVAAAERREADLLHDTCAELELCIPPGLCDSWGIMTDPVVLPTDGSTVDSSSPEAVEPHPGWQDGWGRKWASAIEKNFAALSELLLWKLWVLLNRLRPQPVRTARPDDVPMPASSADAGTPCWQYLCEGLRRRPPRAELGEQWELDSDGELVGVLEREWWQSWGADQSAALERGWREWHAGRAGPHFNVPADGEAGASEEEEDTANFESLQFTERSNPARRGMWSAMRRVWLMPVQSAADTAFYWARAGELLQDLRSALSKLELFVTRRLQEEELVRRQDRVRGDIAVFERGMARDWCVTQESSRRSALVRNEEVLRDDLRQRRVEATEAQSRRMLQERHAADRVLWWVLEHDQRRFLERETRRLARARLRRAEWEEEQKENAQRKENMKLYRQKKLRIELPGEKDGTGLKPPRRFEDKFVLMLRHRQQRGDVEAAAASPPPASADTSPHRSLWTPRIPPASPTTPSHLSVVEKEAGPVCAYCPSVREHELRHARWVGAPSEQKRDYLWAGPQPSASSPRAAAAAPRPCASLLLPAPPAAPPPPPPPARTDRRVPAHFYRVHHVTR